MVFGFCVLNYISSRKPWLVTFCDEIRSDAVAQQGNARCDARASGELHFQLFAQMRHAYSDLGLHGSQRFSEFCRNFRWVMPA